MTTEYDSRTTVIAVLTGIMLTGVVAWFSFGRETATEGYVEKRIDERTANLTRFVAKMESFQESQVAINSRLTTVVEQLAADNRETKQRMRAIERNGGPH